MDEQQHKSSELNNVQETWNKYERDLRTATEKGSEVNGKPDTTPTGGIEEQIRQEAAEYDSVNKESRLPGGDRASVNDDQTSSS